MIIDLEPILSGRKDTIIIDTNIEIPMTLLAKSSIKHLNKVHFVGKIKRIYDLELTLEGILNGTMILADDVTLEEVNYNFEIEVDETIENSADELEEMIVDNKIDLVNILWQLILVEVPSKIHKADSNNTSLSGQGWRLVEEETKEDKNLVFKDLEELLKRKEQ